MRKLRLNLEALQVESFATDADSSRRGTVQGRQSYSGPSHITVCPVICGGDPSYEDTCDVSCGYGVCPQTPNTACEM